MVPIAYMPSPIPRQVGWNLFARTIPFASAFPRTLGGSAPASLFSGPAQRSLTLQPARSPSRLSDPLHQRLQQFRCLHRCSDCYRVERTSSRAGIPPLWTSAFTAHQSCPSSANNRRLDAAESPVNTMRPDKFCPTRMLGLCRLNVRLVCVHP
jgi:hypothetical protein